MKLFPGPSYSATINRSKTQGAPEAHQSLCEGGQSRPASCCPGPVPHGHLGDPHTMPFSPATGQAAPYGVCHSTATSSGPLSALAPSVLHPRAPCWRAHSHAQALTPATLSPRCQGMREGHADEAELGLKPTCFLTAEKMRGAVTKRCRSSLIQVHLGRCSRSAQAPPDTSWGLRDLQPGLEPALRTTPGFWDTPTPLCSSFPGGPPRLICCDSTASFRGE